jgi:predicted MFS family arabinose efflux permease
VGGIELALWCNAVSFLGVIAAVSAVRFSNTRGERRPVFTALADGFRFARSNSAMRRMLVVMIVVIGVGSPFIAFVSQMATNVFDGDSTATSVLVMAQGIGAVTAAFTLGSITNRVGSWRVLVRASLCFAVSLVLYGLAPALWVSAVTLTLVGVSYGYAFTSMMGIAQQHAPDAMRGRVLAVNSFVLGMLYPVGTVVQGAIADVTSLRAVTVGSGVCLMIALGVLHQVDRRRRAEMDPLNDESTGDTVSAVSR